MVAPFVQSVQVSEECLHIGGQRGGLLPSSEVSTTWHLGPAAQVDKLTLGGLARRTQDLTLELRIGGGRVPWIAR
jgi:hypothetical protein